MIQRFRFSNNTKDQKQEALRAGTSGSSNHHRHLPVFWPGADPTQPRTVWQSKRFVANASSVTTKFVSLHQKQQSENKRKQQARKRWQRKRTQNNQQNKKQFSTMQASARPFAMSPTNHTLNTDLCRSNKQQHQKNPLLDKAQKQKKSKKPKKEEEEEEQRLLHSVVFLLCAIFARVLLSLLISLSLTPQSSWQQPHPCSSPCVIKVCCCVLLCVVVCCCVGRSWRERRGGREGEREREHSLTHLFLLPPFFFLLHVVVLI